jgi:hypothetical protein
MRVRLVAGLVTAAGVALAATLMGSASASAAELVEEGPVTAVATDALLKDRPAGQQGKLRVTVKNDSMYQDEGRFLLHLPQTARLTPGQQCVLFDWNLSQWLCEGQRLEAGESHTTVLTVRSIIGYPDYDSFDVGYVQGLSNSNATSERKEFKIKWPAAPQG